MLHIYVVDIPSIVEYVKTFISDINTIDVVSVPLDGAYMTIKSAENPACRLIIISEQVANKFRGVVDNLLSLKKLYLYKGNNEDLEIYLGNMLGISSNNSKVKKDDKVVNISDTSKSNNLYTSTLLEENKSLKESLSVYKKKADLLDNAMLETDNLKNKVLDLNNEIISLKARNADLEPLEGKVEELQNNITYLVTNITSLQTQCNDLQISKDNLEKAIEIEKEKANDISSNKDIQIKQLKTSLNTLKNNIDISDKKASTLEETISSLENEKKGLLSRVDELMLDINELNTKLGAVSNENDAEVLKLKDKVTSLTSINEGLSNDINTKNATLDKFTQAIKVYSARLNNMTPELAKVRKQYKEKVDEITNLAGVLEDKKSELQLRNDEVSKLEGVISDLNSNIEKITSELNESHNRILALEDSNASQLQSLDKLGHLTDKIKSLESINTEQSSRIAELNTSLEDSKNKIITLEKSNQGYLEDISILNKSLEDSNASINDLTKDRDKQASKVEELTNIIEQGNANSTNKEQDFLSRIEELNNTISEKTSIIKDLGANVSSLKSDIADKDTEILNLRGINDELVSKSESMVDEKELFISKNNSLEIELETTRKDLEGVKEKLSNVEYKNKDLEVKIHDKEEEIINLGKKLSDELSLKDMEIKNSDSKDNEIQRLTSNYNTVINKLNNKEIEFNELNTSYNNIKEELNNKDTELIDLKSSIEGLKGSLSDINTKLVQKDDTLKSVNEELDIMQKEEQLLKEALSTKDSEISSLTDKIKKLSLHNDYSDTEQIEKLKQEVSKLNDDIVLLQTELDLKNKTIDDLKAESSNTNYDSILKENRILANKVKSLTNDLDILSDKLYELRGSTVDTDNVEDLQNKVAELESVKEDNSKLLSNIDKLNSELEEFRNKNTLLNDKISNINETLDNISNVKEKAENLERALSDAREMLKDKDLKLDKAVTRLRSLMSSIYTKASGINRLKSVINIELDLNISSSNNICIVAGGSNESIPYTSKFIAELTSSNNEYIVLDLTTETFLDTDLGVSNKNATNKKLNEVSDWLLGKTGIESVLIPTRYKNVMLVTTALTYVNDMFFLNIDWNRILNDLISTGKNIVVNIGCINNCVSNVIFNTLVKRFRAFVVVKGSPSNLRSCYLHLAGFKDFYNLSVVCYDYEQSAKGVYNHLSSKYTTVLNNGTLIGGVSNNAIL